MSRELALPHAGAAREQPSDNVAKQIPSPEQTGWRVVVSTSCPGDVISIQRHTSRLEGAHPCACLQAACQARPNVTASYGHELQSSCCACDMRWTWRECAAHQATSNICGSDPV